MGMLGDPVFLESVLYVSTPRKCRYTLRLTSEREGVKLKAKFPQFNFYHNQKVMKPPTGQVPPMIGPGQRGKGNLREYNWNSVTKTESGFFNQPLFGLQVTLP